MSVEDSGSLTPTRSVPSKSVVWKRNLNVKGFSLRILFVHSVFLLLMISLQRLVQQVPFSFGSIAQLVNNFLSYSEESKRGAEKGKF